MASIINGRLLAQYADFCIIIFRNILRKISEDISTKQNLIKTFKPKLAVIQVGHNEASEIYIKHKKISANKCGIDLEVIRFECSEDSSKLPLNSNRNFRIYDLINQIDPIKDVDGLNCMNTARLSRGDYNLKDPFNSSLLHIPCCALACLEMMKYTGRELRGSRCVIVGHGRLVGAPLADLLLWSTDATVTMCHEYTKDLASEVKRADFIISAVGQRNLIRGDWLKSGAVVIDCGISCVKRGELPPEERGEGDLDDRITVGDVAFNEALHRASWISPVPGGVGPLTVAMLMHNTFKAASLQSEN